MPALISITSFTERITDTGTTSVLCLAQQSADSQEEALKEEREEYCKTEGAAAVEDASEDIGDSSDKPVSVFEVKCEVLSSAYNIPFIFRTNQRKWNVFHQYRNLQLS